jgi:hypothetical protein
MLDIAVAYNKYKFVGHEFLTWLWYMMENEPEKLAETEPEIQSIAIGNRIVFESRNQNDAVEVITIKGDEADLAEGIISLKKGATVSEMNLVITMNDSQWRFGIKGENLAPASLKVPETGNIENMEEEEDGAVLEKLFLCEKAVNVMDEIYRMFIKLRISEDWSRKTVPSIQKWISG